METPPTQPQPDQIAGRKPGQIAGQLARCLEDAWPSRLRNGCRTVVAVSGGADSVALARLLDESPGEQGESPGEQGESPGEQGESPGEQGENDSRRSVILAHFNHGWRGDQSRADQEFVANLADELGRPFVTANADEDPEFRPRKSEDAARNARFRFLRRVTRENGARYLATAHTADDQVETILHRIVRGTGIAGLTGIPSTRVFDEDFVLIRPLLAVRRPEIEKYLTDRGQVWRHDPTNDQLDWTRNRLRHEVLPNLRKHFHCDVDGSLLQLAETATAALAALEPQIAEFETLVQLRTDGFDLPCLPDALPFPLSETLRRVWKRIGWAQRDMNAQHWQALTDVVMARRNVCNLPGNIRAEIKGGRAVVRA